MPSLGGRPTARRDEIDDRIPTQFLFSQLNASDDRGISVVRDQIKSFASSRQLFKKGLKLIILDECDSMTRDSQFALRRGGI